MGTLCKLADGLEDDEDESAKESGAKRIIETNIRAASLFCMRFFDKRR